MKLLASLKKPKTLAMYLISFSALVHLILSSIQIKAISSLTDQICGLVMFIFILFGFVCLFNAIRLKEITVKKLLFCLFFLLVVIGFGSWLLYIYFYSLANQPGVEVGNVVPGIILSIGAMTLYLIGLILTVVAYFVEKKEKEEVSN